MILIRRKYLYMITFLFCVLVVFGELKFFFALKSINMHANLDLKYELENFIFASIVITLIVFFYLINSMRKSKNIFKKMDRIIDLSEYGRHDVGEHLKRMGALGERVNYLMVNLRELSDKKTLKISAVTSVNSFLLNIMSEKVIVTDCKGCIIDVSESFMTSMKVDKKNLVGKNITEIFRNLNVQELLFEMNGERKSYTKEKIVMEINNKEKKYNIEFSPIINSQAELSNVVAVIEKGYFG